MLKQKRIGNGSFYTILIPPNGKGYWWHWSLLQQQCQTVLALSHVQNKEWNRTTPSLSQHWRPFSIPQAETMLLNFLLYLCQSLGMYLFNGKEVGIRFDPRGYFHTVHSRKIPNLFDCWADLLVYTLELKSSLRYGFRHVLKRLFELASKNLIPLGTTNRWFSCS